MESKSQLVTIEEVHEDTKQKEDFDVTNQDSHHYDQNLSQVQLAQKNLRQQILENYFQNEENDYQNEQISDIYQEQINQHDIQNDSSMITNNQMKFVKLDQQKIVNSIDDLNIMKRGFQKIFKNLVGLEQSISFLPDKIGQTFDHMKAVLDKRYQAMLKAFLNAQQKIKDYNIKLCNLENKIGKNQFLRNLQKECEIYQEFSTVLIQDMEKLAVEIKREEKRLNQIHQLYEIRKQRITVLNEQNLFLSGLITKTQKQIRKYNKKKALENQPPKYTSYYAKNDNDIQRIENICGASKVRMFRSTNSNFRSNQNSQNSKFISGASKTLKRNDRGLQIEVSEEQQSQANDFQSNKFSQNQKGLFSTISQVKFQMDYDNKQLDQQNQMKQTLHSKFSSQENDVMQSTQMTFKRQATPQVRIISQAQTTEKFFVHLNKPSLKQAFMSKTNQLFMKKPQNGFQNNLMFSQSQAQLLNQEKNENLHIKNKQYENQNLQTELNIPQNANLLNQFKPIEMVKYDKENLSKDTISDNKENDKNTQTIKFNSQQRDQQQIVYENFDSIKQSVQQEEEAGQEFDSQQQQCFSEEDYKRMILEVDQNTHEIQQQNEKLKIHMIQRCNQFYNRFGLLKQCLLSYKNYLEQNQKMTNSKEGLHGSLIFEMSKAKQFQSQPVLHAFNKQSYKPSYIMDRESRMIVYDTLKCMLDKQIQEKQKKITQKQIDKKLFVNFTPIQLIGMMCLKPESFEEIQFIMERKARMIQEKISSNKVLSSSLYQIKNQ
ncbi:hypothetical protein ABPG72_001327 [Tetrahymena utriculariae]